MKEFARKLFFLVVVLGGITAIVWFGGRHYLAGSVATYSGTVDCPQLDAPVGVSFDARGIPRVRAETDRDLYFAIGYLHASERLFQMELVRRLASGELAEIFGEAAYDTDVVQRQLGFGRKAREDAGALSVEARAMLERYAEGVNHWVRTADLLPPEFKVLRFKPRDWEVEDSLAIAVYQTWYSHELMDRDDTYRFLLDELGEPAREAIEAPLPWSPPTLGSDLEQLLGSASFPMRMSNASNSWAISPSRSASGRAIHAADPHLSINRAPGLWYLASLHSTEGTDVVGVMQPGLPFVVMGHNGRISFAFTVASVDIIDTFEETIHEGDPTTVETPEGPVAVEEVTEEIRVKGESLLRTMTVEITPRGPLIEKNGSSGVSLHWAGFDSPISEMMDAGIKLQRASSFNEFREAVTHFGALDASWVYTDREGQIGYQLGVPVPVRDYADTFVRQRASDSSSAWVGYRPLDEMPSVLDPEEGWIASCNNRPVGGDWPYDLPGFYDPYRITRAATALSAKQIWNADEAGDLQLDLVSGRALRWKNLATESARHAGLDDLAERLRAWDGAMDTDSREAAVFAVWWQSLGKFLFVDELGDEWKDGRAIQEQVLSGSGDILVDDHRTTEVETKVEICATAITAAAVVTAGRTLGEMSTLTVSHPLSRVAVLDKWLGLSRGPVPLGGDLGSLAANFYSYSEEDQAFRSRVGPSMRFVLDWAAIDDFTINIAFGQSGNPFSPHYADFFEPSLRGDRWTVPFSKEKQKENEVSLLELVP